MRRLYLLGILVLVSLKSFSQNATCAQTLRLARATYEQGRLHEIEGQLKTCLESGFGKEDKALKTEGYRILCLSYIYLEEPEKADDAMLKLKQNDPYYAPNPQVDPAEFVALYNTFRALPIFRIGAKLGVDACMPNVVEAATAGELADGSKYSPLIGIHFGFTADLPIKPRLTIHGELLYSQKRFKLTQVFDRQQDVLTGEPLQNVTEGIEQQTWLSLPLLLEYKPLNPKSNFDKKFNPYISGGIAVDYNLSAKITAEQLRDQASAIQEKSYDVERNPINISAVAAMGSKIRVGGGYIVAEVRFLYGITKVSSKEDAYANQEITWEITYADPVFKINSLEISAAYIQNIFNPKKLKGKR